MPKKAKRHVTPSRARYESENRVLSVRVNKDIWDEVEAQRAKGRSLGDLFRIGVGRQNAADTSLEQIRKRAYEQGFAAARSQYMISYRCGRCGDLIETTSEPERVFAATAFEQKGWRHHERPHA